MDGNTDLTSQIKWEPQTVASKIKSRISANDETNKLTDLYLPLQSITKQHNHSHQSWTQQNCVLSHFRPNK